MLSLIGTQLVRLGWRVRALVFDGLMVEHRPPDSAARLQADLRKVEAALCDEGLAIGLAEKPLYGRQGAEVETVRAARDAIGA